MTMGDTIEFPHNQRMFFEEAQKALIENKLNEALEAIQKVYIKDQSPAVIYLYSGILARMEDEEGALEIASEQKDFFLANEEYAITYVLLLVKNQMYLEAETVINENIDNEHSNFNVEWQQLNEEFIRHRDESIRLHENKNQETKAGLMNLESYQPIKQYKILDDARDLALVDLQEVAPKIFMSPFVNGMIQRSLLEILITKQDNQEYLFNWVNQQRTVTPSELTEFEKTPILINILHELEFWTEKQPDLKEPIQTELINDLLILYPFIEEVITDIPYFVKNYIAQYDSNHNISVNTEPETDEQKALDKWIIYLNQISGR